MSDPTAYLLAEISALRRENRRLRGTVRWLTMSRDLWKHRARGYKWGGDELHRKVSTPSPVLSPTRGTEG